MRRSKRAVIGIAIAIGLLGLVPGSVAAVGGQPACGDMLTVDTTLTADLDCSAYNGTALYMGANGVKLDLGGYTIWGFTGDDSASGVDTNGYNKTKITNGTIENFGTGIYMDNSSQTKISWLNINGEAADTNDYGIRQFYGAGGKISHVTIDPVTIGMYFYGSADVKVINNMVTADDSAFYTEYGSRMKFFNNTAVADTGFSDNFSGNNRYVGNTANDGESGFYLNCDSYGKVRMENNTANGNQFYGFYLYYCYADSSSWAPGAGSVVKGNTANNNGGSFVGIGFYDEQSINSTWTDNTANDNGEYGFEFKRPGGDVITNNRAHRNGDTGFYLHENASSGHQNVYRFSWNRANDNGVYGHYGDFAVPGKGNRASGNSIVDCFNVRCT